MRRVPTVPIQGIGLGFQGRALKIRRVPTVLNSGAALAASERATANVKGDAL